MSEPRILVNRAKCLACGKVLESRYHHDYRVCGCPQQTMVDGGQSYLRRGGADLDMIEELSEWEAAMPHERSTPEGIELETITNDRQEEG
jgi:hypothetical protein